MATTQYYLSCNVCC